MASARGPPEEAPPRVVWNEKEGKFETEEGEAFLQYHFRTLKGGGEATAEVVVMDMVHTYVPRTKRGQGVAALLCAAAFDHARTNSLPVVPTCTYVSDTFLPRNQSWNWIVYGSKDPKPSM